jgi:hypothetical protein
MKMAPTPPVRRSDRKGSDLDVPATRGQQRLGDEWIEFRPARWLLAAVALLSLWLVRPKIGKRALLALAWRFTPRRPRLIAAGAAGLTLMALAGSVAALVLVLDQLA